MKTNNAIYKARKELVLNLLETNTEGEYISSKNMIKYINGLNGSTIRKIINELRQEGIPIVSSSRGYKLTNDIVDIVIYAFSLKNRINEMTKAYQGIMYNVKKNNIEIKDFV